MSAASIPRHVQEDEGSFAGLRARGMKLARQISGHCWTDYNLHDPGVTILEQLCYVLTDLLYRADFPVADHLTGPDGTINFSRQGLCQPAAIFPCRPTTTNDYRRVLLDCENLLDSVAFDAAAQDPASGTSIDGVHHAHVTLSEGAAQFPVNTRVEEVRSAYLRNRNLCEDIDENIVVERAVPCDLHADVEIGGTRDPVDIVAEIYERCSRYIAATMTLQSFGEMVRDGATLEEILTGPRVRNGFIRAADLEQGTRTSLFMSDVAAQVRAVDGVQEVKGLSVQPEGGGPASPVIPWRGSGWALRLRLPGDRLYVRLTRRGSDVPVSAEDVRSRYDDLRIVRQARKSAGSDIEATFPMPHGEHHDLQQYYSVRNHFPPIYGLHNGGAPDSAPAQVKAQTRQLTAYLVLFEQVMVHSLANLHHLRDLYSWDVQERQSYWWRMLDDATVPGLAGLYRQSREEIERKVYAPFDDFANRKGRVLDYLLALHGETLAQGALRQFCGYYGTDELQAALVDNKSEFLRHAPDTSRDRAAGFDYRKPSWNTPSNSSGLHMRVCLLLGFTQPYSRPLTHAIMRHKRELVSAERRRPVAQNAPGTRESPGPGFSPLPPESLAAGATSEEYRGDLAQVIPLRVRYITDSLLRAGVDASRYWVSRSHSGRSYRVMLGPDDENEWWHIADSDSEEHAIRIAASLRRLLLQMNRESEGLHVVEHVLLRPVGGKTEHAGLAITNDFYSLRATVLFPSWTSRCGQANFRLLARQTVEASCPAHVHAECVWLDFREMRRFEVRYERWLNLKITWSEQPASDDVVDRLNGASREVIESLLNASRTPVGPAAGGDAVVQGDG